MADRWALIVAADKFLDPGLGAVPYAEAGAKALADALAAAGYPKANQVVLLGSHATTTVIESRLRKLKKTVKRGDTLLAYWAGRGFSRGGQGVLASWDTQPDDLADTTVAVGDFVAALAGTKAAQVIVLLDVGTGPDVPGFASHLDPEELAKWFGESAKAVGLLSADAGEASHTAAELKRAVWSHLLVEALSGRAAKATDKAGSVTALSLHRFIEDELPRLLRKHFEPGIAQTPLLFGEQNAGSVIADLSPLLGQADGGFLLDPDRLRRVLFRSESSGRVKDLTHWRKTFDLPTNAGASSRKFVARIADPDVRADLNAVFETAREHLGYKRKDVEVTTGPDGTGTVRTPDFEYTVTAALDADDPSKVAWVREVGQFADPGFVRGPGFDAVFGKLFDQLAFEFAKPVDVAVLVDRLEDRPPKGAKLQVDSDGASCDITLAGFAGRVTVTRQSLVVRGRGGKSAGLLDQFLAFLSAVGPLGEPLMLRAAH